MDGNQIIAALQIENYEVRLVVGQFYRDRFDVIAKGTKRCKAVEGVRIKDENKAIEAIRSLVSDTEAKIGVRLESVILVVPGYRFTREKRYIERLLDKKYVTYSDIKMVNKEAYRSNVGHDSEIINVACAYYVVNGIVYPKIPLNEKSEMIACDVDLICGDKLIMYDYVMTVEKAGLKVLDIVQDGFASSKEAALFEQSFDNYVINIYLEKAHTVYSLIYNGRLVAGFSANNGYDVLVKPIMEKYNLSYTASSRLLFRYAELGKEDAEDRVISRWMDNDEEKSITYKELQETIAQATKTFVDEMYVYCSNIIRYDNVTVVVSGHGASACGLDNILTQRFQKRVKAYCPDLLGVREHKWVALLGAFYNYSDIQKINETTKNCVDKVAYETKLMANVEEEDQQPESQPSSLTSKLKTITDKLFIES